VDGDRADTLGCLNTKGMDGIDKHGHLAQERARSNRLASGGRSRKVQAPRRAGYDKEGAVARLISSEQIVAFIEEGFRRNVHDRTKLLPCEASENRQIFEKPDFGLEHGSGTWPLLRMELL
jgi:hypothetical protein